MPKFSIVPATFAVVLALSAGAAHAGGKVSQSTISTNGEVGGSANALAVGVASSATNNVGGVAGTNVTIDRSTISARGRVGGSVNALAVGVGASASNTIGGVTLGAVR